MPMKIYVIRHGETRLKDIGQLQGWVDEPLNENGISLARITGEALKEVPFDIVFTSPLKRARETAELVTAPSQEYQGREIPIVNEDRLKELNWGSWESLGCTEENFAIPDRERYNKFFTDGLHFEGSPDGESIADVCLRTKSFFEELIHDPRYQDKTVLISTHGCAMRAMLNSYYEDSSDFWQGTVPYNCAVTILTAEDGEVHFEEKDKIYYDPSLCVIRYKVIGDDEA